LAPLASGMHSPPAGGWLRRGSATTIRSRVTRGTDHSRHLRHESAAFGRRFPAGRGVHSPACRAILLTTLTRDWRRAHQTSDQSRMSQDRPSGTAHALLRGLRRGVPRPPRMMRHDRCPVRCPVRPQLTRRAATRRRCRGSSRSTRRAAHAARVHPGVCPGEGELRLEADLRGTQAALFGTVGVSLDFVVARGRFELYCACPIGVPLVPASLALRQ
jgi:hypothetical protein